jgi:hemoglobin
MQVGLNNTGLQDIETKEDLTFLMQTFYGKLLQIEEIKPFFAHINFEQHLPQIVQFWAFILLDEPGYNTNVTEKHLHMPLKKEHFEIWLKQFESTVNKLFQGEKANLAIERAKLIAWTIGNKMKLN